jgi:hypothetical protein
VVAALAEPWSFDHFVSANKTRFDRRFHNCLTQEFVQTENTGRRELEICFEEVRRGTRQPITCQNALASTVDKELLNDIARVTRNGVSFASTSKGAQLIQSANFMGRTNWTSIMQWADSSTNLRARLSCGWHGEVALERPMIKPTPRDALEGTWFDPTGSSFQFTKSDSGYSVVVRQPGRIAESGYATLQAGTVRGTVRSMAGIYPFELQVQGNQMAGSALIAGMRLPLSLMRN